MSTPADMRAAIACSMDTAADAWAGAPSPKIETRAVPCPPGFVPLGIAGSRANRTHHVRGIADAVAASGHCHRAVVDEHEWSVEELWKPADHINDLHQDCSRSWHG